MNEIKSVNDNDLKGSWKSQIEKFITHYVWHSQDPVTNDKIKHGQRYQTPFWVVVSTEVMLVDELVRQLKFRFNEETMPTVVLETICND